MIVLRRQESASLDNQLRHSLVLSLRAGRSSSFFLLRRVKFCAHGRQNSMRGLPILKGLEVLPDGVRGRGLEAVVIGLKILVLC